MTLPGLYLAVTNFHTQILPTTLILSFAAARQGVPFPSVVEVILMELSFELLRGGGHPSAGSNGKYDRDRRWIDHRTGSSGSEYCKPGRGDRHCLYGTLFLCNTKRGICRSLPYSQILFIGMCAWLGFFGFLIALLAIFLHLASLKSFGIPYLMPFAGSRSD